MEEYSEMNGQNDEQNTGGEFGGSYYQHNAMPREKKSGQNSCAGYILVGILCLLVGIGQLHNDAGHIRHKAGGGERTSRRG